MKSSISFIFLYFYIIITTLVLWLVSIVGKLFFIKEDSLDKKMNFECGFENLNTTQGSFQYRNEMSFFFLLMYEVELLLLLPLAFNSSAASYSPYKTFIILIVVFYTCVFDVKTGAVEYEH